ncbi:hypothetical protein ACFYNY_20680 [Streptomyces sp. NPDC006530]|uniref:hypothetical protein n=1 Tax=Streptomyces sp. NPDC006530 TaxID=3364750 RepID=UPI0036C96BCB
MLASTAALIAPASAEAMAAARPVDPNQRWSPPHTALPHTKPIHGKATPGPAGAKPHYRVPGEWPGPGTTSTPAAPTAVDPTGVSLKTGIVDSAKAQALGERGPVVTVERGATAPSAHIRVAIDVRRLDATYGADASARAHLVALPGCALTTPDADGCRQRTAVPSHYDAGTGRLVAEVAAPATSHDSAQPMVFAAETASGGGGGDYTASGLNPSAAWSGGTSSGGFDYSYPVQVPASIGQDAPQIALSYSSSAVDGRTSSTNAQSSWIGDGWDYTPGSVERSYKNCDKDGIKYSADSCWGGFNASLSLEGHSSELVRDDTSGTWRLAQERRRL